jgi:hypothetical protein
MASKAIQGDYIVVTKNEVAVFLIKHHQERFHLSRMAKDYPGNECRRFALPT